MSHHLLKALLVLGLLLSAKPQAAPVSVKLRVLVVDKELNQKAVPFYIVSFRNATGEAPIELKTDLEGKADGAGREAIHVESGGPDQRRGTTH
jgi:hypothetical protein